MKETMYGRIRRIGQYLIDHVEDFVSKTEGITRLNISFDVDVSEPATIQIDKEIAVIDKSQVKTE